MFSMFFPHIDLTFTKKEIFIVLNLFNQDRMSLWNILMRIQYRFILLAKLFYIRKFLLCYHFYILLSDDSHSDGNRVITHDWNLNNKLILDMNKSRIEQEGNDLLTRHKLDYNKSTEKANTPKYKDYLPEGYSFIMLGDYTIIYPSY